VCPPAHDFAEDLSQKPAGRNLGPEVLMAVDCASCPSYVCRAGQIEALPQNCPMPGDFPDFRELYANRQWKARAISSPFTWCLSGKLTHRASRVGRKSTPFLPGERAVTCRRGMNPPATIHRPGCPRLPRSLLRTRDHRAATCSKIVTLASGFKIQGIKGEGSPETS
jgi:hypothetical protein